MNIAYISKYNPANKIARSGVPYSIYQQLSRGNNVIWIEPRIETIFEKILYILLKLFKKILSSMGYNLMHTAFEAKVYSYSVQRQLDKIEYDCIFTIAGKEIVYLKTDKPIFSRTDAIIQSFRDYYIKSVPDFAFNWASNIEKRAIAKQKNIFVASRWVLNEAIKYNIKDVEKKFVVVESGANLDSNEVRCRYHDYNLNKELNMIIVGYDVMRKGLDVAFEAAKILNEKYNVKAYVTVMGGRPSDEMLLSGLVRYVGMKDKNNPKEYNEFYDIFSSADLFIFPTKAECHGIVNCEAAAYGLPIFANNTGGVGDYCIDGVNGRCLPVTSRGEEYAKAIYDALSTGKMAEYSTNSRKLYVEKFNWQSWGNRVLPIIQKACK